MDVLASEGRSGASIYRLSFDPKGSFAYRSDNSIAREDSVYTIGSREIPSRRNDIPPSVEPDNLLGLEELPLLLPDPRGQVLTHRKSLAPLAVSTETSVRPEAVYRAFFGTVSMMGETVP